MVPRAGVLACDTMGASGLFVPQGGAKVFFWGLPHKSGTHTGGCRGLSSPQRRLVFGDGKTELPLLNHFFCSCVCFLGHELQAGAAESSEPLGACQDIQGPKPYKPAQVLKPLQSVLNATVNVNRTKTASWGSKAPLC